MNFPCYPFTPSDLADLLWARDHHRQAHDAIVEAENRATDEPARRPKANVYIRDCLANIRRRRERVEQEQASQQAELEQAETIAFGFAMQDRLLAEAELRRVARGGLEAASPASGTGNVKQEASAPQPAKRKAMTYLAHHGHPNAGSE